MSGVMNLFSLYSLHVASAITVGLQIDLLRTFSLIVCLNIKIAVTPFLTK